MKPAAGKKNVPSGKGRAKSPIAKRSRPANDHKRESGDIERAVYDGMQDLRAEKPK